MIELPRSADVCCFRMFLLSVSVTVRQTSLHNAPLRTALAYLRTNERTKRYVSGHNKHLDFAVGGRRPIAAVVRIPGTARTHRRGKTDGSVRAFRSKFLQAAQTDFDINSDTVRPH